MFRNFCIRCISFSSFVIDGSMARSWKNRCYLGSPACRSVMLELEGIIIYSWLSCYFCFILVLRKIIGTKNESGTLFWTLSFRVGLRGDLLSSWGDAELSRLVLAYRMTLLILRCLMPPALFFWATMPIICVVDISYPASSEFSCLLSSYSSGIISLLRTSFSTFFFFLVFSIRI